MTDTKEIMGLLITLAALWHVIGFAFGLVYVHFSLKSLFNFIPYDRQWSRIIRYSDLHLWLSGFALIALGLMQKGIQVYLSNPKLCAKVTVVVVWLLSTQLMRRIGVPHLQKGNLNPMIQLSSINISCWVYGAFLGCAKPLAYGVVSYPAFLLGFACVAVISFLSLRYIRTL